MIEGVSIKESNEYHVINNALLECASDLYDQSKNDRTIIGQLANKYSQNASFVLAENDSDIIGFCAYYSNDLINEIGYLSMIVVKSAYRKYGIGTLLLLEAVSGCARRGMKYLRLEVDDSNSTAVSFYKKHGFIYEKKCSDHSSYYLLDIDRA